jgi:hypothetical protein
MPVIVLDRKQHITELSVLLYDLHLSTLVRFEVLKAVTMKNAVVWDLKTQIVPHKKYNTSLLQSPAG